MGINMDIVNNIEKFDFSINYGKEKKQINNKKESKNMLLVQMMCQNGFNMNPKKEE